MRMAFQWITIFALILWVWNGPLGAAPARADQADGPPDLAVRSAVLMDMKTGQVLYAKNPDESHYPASITKILTAIVALERGHLSDRITTSHLATTQDGNRIYLVEGEQHTLEELLYGMMLNSGNDAAVAIAEHYGGSVQGFADIMNAKAKQIGALRTHFTNPNGLHDPNHVTTAYDMCLIGRYAMQNPTFRQIVSTKTYHWHGQEWESELVNINQMLWTYPGATGIKTGFTDQAQQTMVVSATRGNESLIATLMVIPGQEAMREEATKLLDWGFAHFTTQRVVSAGEPARTLELPGHQTAQALLSRSVWYTFARGSSPAVTRDIQLQEPKLPLQKGAVVGQAIFMADGRTIAAVPLVSDRAVNPPPTPLWRWIVGLMPGALLLIPYWKLRHPRQRPMVRPHRHL